MPPDHRSRPPGLAVLGDSGVGKTALSWRLKGDEFRPSASSSDFSGHRIISSDTTLLDIPGTAPSEEIQARLISYAPTALLILVDSMEFSLPGGEFASAIERCRHLIPDSLRLHGHLSQILVATRCDRGIAVDGKSLLDIALKWGFDYAFLTSAKSGQGVQPLRNRILAIAASMRVPEPPREGSVMLLVRQMSGELCRLVARTPTALAAIEWRDLERVLAAALESIGFSVRLTRSSKDGGKDVIATCVVEGISQVYYVEIKHWREGGRPGLGHVSSFVEVNAKDGTDGGLFLSSSGYTKAVYGRVAEISRQRVHLGGKRKIIQLCMAYERAEAGLWTPVEPLPKTLFDDTM